MNRIERIESILQRLSRGEYLHTPSLVEEYETTKKIILTDFNQYIFPYFKQSIYYDYSSKTYKAKSNFLALTLLSAKELAILTILKAKTKDKFSDERLEEYTEVLFEKFEKALEDNFYKSASIEKIDEFKSEIITIKNAIEQGIEIICEYGEKTRVVQPLKILNLEGFWYLIVYEPNDEKVKTFHLDSIKNIEITSKKFEFAQDVIESFENAINAYYKVQNQSISVELYLDKDVSKYFLRRPISKSQRVISTYSDGGCDIELSVTDFMEIIPTIQRYAPHIGVIAPIELREQVKENFMKYIKEFS